MYNIYYHTSIHHSAVGHYYVHGFQPLDSHRNLRISKMASARLLCRRFLRDCLPPSRQVAMPISVDSTPPICWVGLPSNADRKIVWNYFWGSTPDLMGNTPEHRVR